MELLDARANCHKERANPRLVRERVNAEGDRRLHGSYCTIGMLRRQRAGGRRGHTLEHDGKR